MNKLNLLGFFFSFVSHILSSDASLLPLARAQPIEEFFPGIKGNLTKVTWDHAVNSLEQLDTSLKSDVMMIEADIVMGTLYPLYDESNRIPIMAHPPNDTSNLSLENFLKLVIKFNRESEKNKKGVKLDFKTTEAFEHSVEIISNSYEEMNFPVWLNADILPGPINANDTPVDPDKFIEQSKSFPKAVLSLGWKTNYGNGIVTAYYLEKHVDNMLDVINSHFPSGEDVPSITFPMRAGIAAQSSYPIMLRLLDKVKDSTFTIWGSEKDEVQVESLRNLIKLATIQKVYVDVPENLLKELKLDELNAGISFKPFALITAITALFVKIF